MSYQPGANRVARSSQDFPTRMVIRLAVIYAFFQFVHFSDFNPRSKFMFMLTNLMLFSFQTFLSSDCSKVQQEKGEFSKFMFILTI